LRTVKYIMKMKNKTIKRDKCFKYFEITFNERLNIRTHKAVVKNKVIKFTNKLFNLAINKYKIPKMVIRMS